MNELIEDYKKGNLILFIGAGVSANLGLPSWSKLIDHLAKELGYDPDVFKTYGDSLALASFYKIKVGSLGKLRSMLDKEWHNPKINVSKSKIHEYIVKGKFPIIYTTNYDNWIENACQHYKIKYNKIVNVNDIVNSNNKDKEIIKFHGDFTDDLSIVLDEDSYYKRLQFETPLDIKLRSDILGKSVLFIGYSLTDINIRHLFYKLHDVWQKHGNGMPRPNSYLFSSKTNPIQKEVLSKWGIKTITSKIDDPGKSLEDFLEKLYTCK